MITVLSSPKPWVGEATRLQEAAIRNWLSLGPGIEVILYGDAPGTREASQRLGVSHVPDVAASPSGVPFFGAMVGHAASHGRHDQQLYANCDILLQGDISGLWARIPWARALMIGQRVDLSEGAHAADDAPRNDRWLQEQLLAGRMRLHPPAGSDYFAFSRGIWDGVPDIVVGRGGYDTALVAFCLTRKIPVVDVSLAVLALHPWHDYGHLSGGEFEVFEGADALRNRRETGGFSGLSLEDATWYLDRSGVHRNWARRDFLRSLAVTLTLRHRLPALARMLMRVRGAVVRLRLLRTRSVGLSQVLPGGQAE